MSEQNNNTNPNDGTSAGAGAPTGTPNPNPNPNDGTNPGTGTPTGTPQDGDPSNSGNLSQLNTLRTEATKAVESVTEGIESTLTRFLSTEFDYLGLPGGVKYEANVASEEFKLYQGKIKSKTEAEQAIKELVESGPDYGDTTESKKVAESEFGAQMISAKGALAAANDSINVLDLSASFASMAKWEASLPVMAGKINELIQTPQNLSNLTELVTSLDQAIEVQVASDEAQQAYINNPNSSSYNAWLEAKTASEDAVSALNTPKIESVDMSVTSGGNLKEIGDLVATVTFTEPVVITGEVSIELNLNPNSPSNSIEIATFAVAPGVTHQPMQTLDLVYTPSPSDGNPYVSSLEVVANSLSLSAGSTIANIQGLPSLLDHSSTVNGGSINNTDTDTPPASIPELTSISVLEMDGRDLSDGDVVTVVAEFNQAMFLTDVHTYHSNVSFALVDSVSGGSIALQASLASGDGTSTLTYEYTVEGDIYAIATLEGAPSLDDIYSPNAALTGSATIFGDVYFGSSEATETLSGMEGVNNLDYALTFPKVGFTTIVKGDPGGFGSLALEEYSANGPSTFLFVPQTADVVKIINESNYEEFTATRNSDGTVLIDGGEFLGRVLLQDVNYLTDGDEDQFFNIGLEDYLATESSKDHDVSGSIFGGDELVVDELAAASFSDDGWETTGATSLLKDAGGTTRAELTEVTGKPNAYALKTFLVDGTPAETYNIEGTEVLSVRGLNGTITKDLGSADVVKPLVDDIQVTSSATKFDDAEGSAILVEGNVVTATVEFSEAVFVQGKPTIQLQIGPDTTNLVEAVFAGNSNHTFVQDDSGNYVELEAPFSDSITPSKLQAFTYVIKANDVGEVIIVDNKLNLDGGLILDAAGNAADLSYTEVNYHNDNAPYMDAPPTVAITMADSNGNAISGGLIKGETADVTFTFSEEVYSDLTNGISDAIVVENGSITEFQVYPVDSTKYTAKYTPNGNVESALNNISVSMADVKDFAGNSGVGITKSANFTVDTKIPTVQITMEDSNGEAISGALIKGDYANVAFTFSEEVFSVISSNIGDVISAKNGSITEFKVDGDDPTKYTAKYTPDNNVESALNKISVDMQGVKDTAGNTGDGIAQSDTYKVDTLSPTINLPGPDSGTKVVFDKENNTIEVALEFSEVINLKSGAALTLTLLVDDDNGEVDSVDVTFEAKNDLTSSNTYILTSTAPVVSGLFDINGIQVKANSLKVTRTDGEPAGFLQNFKDLAGNFLTGTFNEFTVVPDHSIDSRTHRATKQDEGYVSFSKLLPDIPSGDNKILDESNINTIDTIDTITGGDGLDQIFGGEGNEHLIGKAGNDFLKGGAGNDILDGGLGNDYLYADIGDDTINGGDGEDTILFDKVLEQTNKLVLDLFKDVSKQAYNAELGHNTISEIENAIGTNMGDVMNGNGYNNIINGADGDDIINGGRGNDKLLGGAGDDTLKGGRGKDTLEGGAGKDILNGGAGADTFVFTLADLTMTEDTGASGYFTSTHSDTVQRFNARADKIEIIGEYEGQVNLKEGKLFIDVKDDQGENNSSFDENTDWLLAEGFHDSITYNAGSGDVAFLDLSSFTEIV